MSGSIRGGITGGIPVTSVEFLEEFHRNSWRYILEIFERFLGSPEKNISEVPQEVPGISPAVSREFL